MAYANLTNWDAALKDYYTKYKIENLTYMNNPLFALLAKKESGGRRLPLVAEYGNPQGTSSVFSTAQTYQNPSSLTSYYLTMKTKYTLATMDGPTIQATKSDLGAFLNVMTTEINNSQIGHTRALQIDLYGDGSGSIGQVSGISTLTITLTNPTDVVKFEPNMYIVGCATLTGGTPSASPGKVVSINRSAGTITVDALPTGLTTNWYIFRAGDYGAVLTGVKGWLPLTAPTSGDSFFGVDRSVDTDRLAGVRLVATGAPVEEVLIELAARVGVNGGRPNYAMMNNLRFAELTKSLNNQRQYIQYEDISLEDADVGFRSIVVQTPYGDIKCVADNACDYNLIYMLQLETWGLYSSCPVGTMIDDDGITMLRVSNADAVEVRIRSYPQLGCKAPGWNGVASL